MDSRKNDKAASPKRRNGLVSTVAGMGAVYLLLAVVGGCNGGGDTPPPLPPPPMVTPMAQFKASGTAEMVGGVRLLGATAAADRVRVDVMIGGPTNNADLYAFAFDITLSPAGVVQDLMLPTGGDALDQETVYAALNAAKDRVVVGVTKTGNVTGDEIAMREAKVLSFELKVGSGTTSLKIEGATDPFQQNPTNQAAALESDLSVSAAVTFDTVAATITR